MKPRGDIKWAVATISLGKHPAHTLERKIQAAAANGFKGIELVYNELLQHAASHSQSSIESARRIGAFATQHSITILTISAFKNFEGNLEISLLSRLTQAQEWIDVAVALGTRILQVPSMFLPNSTGDEKLIISELQALADLAACHDLAIAYEAVAFAQHNALWQDSLRIAKKVDRPNFKICLDSYHIHARIWGDACAADGRIPGGDVAAEQSTRDFLSNCPKELISYMQLSDASRWSPPLSIDDAAFESLEVRDPRLLWSRIARPFPLEEPGYFPVVDIARAWLVEYGWNGWVSLEGFLKETEREDCGPEVMARRGKESIEKLMAQL
jgi:4-hydroxyphenylpyruvate dioxygenase